ncbi:MAG: hypothetical protein Q8O32_01770 [bacterium]|nr:hypothetical protein [bacterium]
MYQINVGLSWRQIGISESDVLLLLHICHRNQVIHELRAILAKNEYTPLNFDDAEKLSYILDEIERCHIDWHKLPVSKNVLIEIIDVAACGYEHCCQQTA